MCLQLLSLVHDHQADMCIRFLYAWSAFGVVSLRRCLLLGLKAAPTHVVLLYSLKIVPMPLFPLVPLTLLLLSVLPVARPLIRDGAPPCQPAHLPLLHLPQRVSPLLLRD